ncbi:MAG: ATP-grasp domain-containing protein [Candidatus Hydrogenedentota bacterium]|nr:MAG: ATP-grasp domain-containing protein [Candidatus Hydrogenedentota bacterium]
MLGREATILIVGAGPMQVPAINIAREMGLKTLVTDYNPDAVGLALADIPIVMSTKDVEGTVRVARQYRHSLRGVLTVGTDASLTVAAVSGALGLPGIHYEAAENATHKVKMRRALREGGVAVPDFKGVWTIEEAKEAANEIGYPVVLKPVDNMGARGVSRATGPGTLEPAFRYAKSCSTTGEVIVEKMMTGPELSIDALVWDGDIICIGIADRIIGLPPYFVELGHTLPTREPDSVLREVEAVMLKAVRALGITTGAAKGDIKLTPDGPMVGEVAARLSGGWMSSHTFPLATGYSMIRGAIEIALGVKPEIPRFQNRVAMERAIISTPGVVTKIDGIRDARSLPGVAEVILNCRIGDVVNPPRSNMEKQGHVIVAGASYDECEAILRRAFEMIVIETKSERTLTPQIVAAQARQKFGRICRACRVCDGVYCAGMMPGMGGIGTGKTFMNNLEALEQYRIRERVIHDVSTPRLVADFFGVELAFPVMAAPVTGTVTNMGGAITEEEYARAVVNGSVKAGTIAWLGDGATPEKYRIGLEAASLVRGHAVPIFKPRSQEEIRTRIRAAEAAGCVAVGVDIDGAAFLTMRRRGQAVSPKSVDELRELAYQSERPFILKGVMTPYDAELAVRAGAAALVVSNHGGRVMDQMPGTADVLPEIVSAVKGAIRIGVDGGIRTGEDVLKMLALGAEFCLIGRPVAIAAVGAGEEGVRLFWETLCEELERALILTGTRSVAEVKPDVLISVSS